MVLELIALLCTGLFAGAAVYITLVEHPRGSSADPPWPWRSFGRAIGGRPRCKRHSPPSDCWRRWAPGPSGGACPC